MPSGLTRTQRDAMLIVQELADQNGGAGPSLETLAIELDVQAKSTALRLLRSLEERGWIKRESFRRGARIRVLHRLPMPEEPEIVGLFEATGA